MADHDASDQHDASSGSTPTTQPTLARQLSTADAVWLGLGSMLGAGVFVVFAPAAQTAGRGLLVGLALAALVAYANATASAQLASQYPTSGDTYIYGRERLGPWWGFMAGWGFLVGKTASCAAMALAFAAYVVPEAWRRPAAVAAVIALTTVNYHGVTRTARLTRLIVLVVLLVLTVVVVVGWRHPSHGVATDVETVTATGWYGIAQSAGLLFFAFAGYARIATMGEEVRDPQRSIPRAILLALAVTLAIYVAIALTVLRVLGVQELSEQTAPLAATVLRSEVAWAVGLVSLGAAAAALGALLALIAGVGRTALAMARTGDLPGWLVAVHPRHRVPHRIDVVLAVAVVALVLTLDLRAAIGFSSFGVLCYYFVANLAAWTQTGPHRRFPRFLQVIGMLGCAVLVLTLPPTAVATGIGVYAAGLGYRLIRVGGGTLR